MTRAERSAPVGCCVATDRSPRWRPPRHSRQSVARPVRLAAGIRGARSPVVVSPDVWRRCSPDLRRWPRRQSCGTKGAARWRAIRAPPRRHAEMTPGFADTPRMSRSDAILWPGRLPSSRHAVMRPKAGAPLRSLLPLRLARFLFVQGDEALARSHEPHLHGRGAQVQNFGDLRA